jgi:hypothetical protein
MKFKSEANKIEFRKFTLKKRALSKEESQRAIWVAIFMFLYMVAAGR